MTLSGLISLPWWGYILVTLGLTHITIAAVTIYLHRHQTHHGLELHPIVSHFFRFWLWFTTGMVTKEWVAIHRKHHAKCETAADPHSPQIVGIKKVLVGGTELYKAEAKNKETLEKYGHGTPNDWIERHIYSRYQTLGIGTMLVINVLLFGPIGITIWAVQMLWIPFFAAGVINGIGHYCGYRNFSVEDASRNIIPWGILIGGEELHNNHHAYASSAKLSNKWYEIDIGWVYICILELLGLSRVKKVAPKLRLNNAKTACDFETLQAIITHRYEILTKYTASLKDICSEEIAKLKQRAAHQDSKHLKILKRWLHRDADTLRDQDKEKLNEILNKSNKLKIIYSMRQELSVLWTRSSASREQLLKQLQDWCHRAEMSGIAPLKEFSHRLRCYA